MTALKKLTALTTALLIATTPALADGQGRSHRGNNHYHGNGANWVVPALIVGGIVYGASQYNRPAPVYVPPPVYVEQPPVYVEQQPVYVPPPPPVVYENRWVWDTYYQRWVWTRVRVQ